MRWFLLFIIFTSCSSTPGKDPETLRISFNTQPNTLDPRKAGDFVSSTLICMLYDGLTRCVPGGDVEPALAQSVEISKNEKVYLFHLRKAFWSDGTPITAYDFEKCWKRVILMPSVGTYLFYPIKNAERCVKGEVCIDQVGIKALDERTFQVELEQPTPYFYSLTAFPTFLPIPSHSDNVKISSGPFRIESIVNNGEIILTKNLVYWNREEVFIDQIHISIIQDEMTALQMFEQGDLDWLGGPLSPLPPDPLDQLKEQLEFVPTAASTLVLFNTQSEPFNNIHLRKAFSYAIDRDEIVEKVTPFGQIPAASILPPSLTSQNLLGKANPESARYHLKIAIEELGIVPSDLNQLTFYFKPNQIDKRLAQTLQRQWQEVLGVTVQLNQLDLKSHGWRLQSKNYQIALANWIAQFDDPISILERFKDKANLKNYPGWNNPKYVELLNQATHSSKRMHLLQEAERILADEMPLTPIYHWRSPALCGPRIESTGSTPSGGILFERFRLYPCKKIVNI